MKFRLILALSLLLSLDFVHAYPLYRVEKAGATNWLMGVIHTPTRVPESVTAKIKNARIALFEVIPDDLQKVVDVQRAMVTNTIKRNLKRQLSSTDYLSLRAALRTVDGEIMALDFWPTSQLVLSLNESLQNAEVSMVESRFRTLNPETQKKVMEEIATRLRALNLDPEAKPEDKGNNLKLDDALEKIAKTHGVPTVSLDHPELIAAANATVTETEALQSIKKSLKRLRAVKEMSLEDLTTYLFGVEMNSEPFVQKLYWAWTPESPYRPVTMPQLKNIPPFHFISAINYRHVEWLPKIVEEFDRGGAFAALGDGHVTGDPVDGSADVKSLVELLRARGFVVTPEPMDCDSVLKRGEQS